MPHQTHWLYKVIGQPATFPLNRPWNWLRRPQCYYLNVFHLQPVIKTWRQEGAACFCIIQATLRWWSSSPCSHLWCEVSPSGNSPKEKLFKAGRGEIWHLRAEHSRGLQRRNKERRELFFFKLSSKWVWGSPFHLPITGMMRKEEKKTWLGLKEAVRGSASPVWAAIIRPLSPSSGGRETQRAPKILVLMITSAGRKGDDLTNYH